MKTLSLLVFCIGCLRAQRPVSTAEAEWLRVSTETTQSLIEQLQARPINVLVVGALKARANDPAVIPAMRDAFRLERASGAIVAGAEPSGMRVFQFLAMTLIGLGLHDDAFSDELIRYALEAIVADPPQAFLRNAAGIEDPKMGHDPGFDSWCAERSLEFVPCQKLLISHAMDLGWLAAYPDRRGIPALRDALRMTNPVMVMEGAMGLARQNDIEALPLIAQACTRFSFSDVEPIVSS